MVFYYHYEEEMRLTDNRYATECQQLIREYAAGGIHTHVMGPMMPTPEIMEDTLLAFSKERFSF